MKIAICNEMFEDWKIEDVFAYAAELGYEAVEIAPFTLADSVLDISDTERARIRKAAEAAKIEIAGLHWLLVSPPGLYVNHPDAEIREETRDYFLALVNLCADLGGEVMVIGSPQQRNVMDPAEFRRGVGIRTGNFLRKCRTGRRKRCHAVHGTAIQRSDELHHAP